MKHLEKLALSNAVRGVAKMAPQPSTRELERLLPIILGGGGAGAGAGKTLAPQVELIRKYLASTGAKSVNRNVAYHPKNEQAWRIPG